MSWQEWWIMQFHHENQHYWKKEKEQVTFVVSSLPIDVGYHLYVGSNWNFHTTSTSVKIKHGYFHKHCMSIMKLVHTILLIIISRDLCTISRIGHWPYKNSAATSLHAKKESSLLSLPQTFELNNYMHYSIYIPIWLWTKDYSICNLPWCKSLLCFNTLLNILYDAFSTSDERSFG